MCFPFPLAHLENSISLFSSSLKPLSAEDVLDSLHPQPQTRLALLPMPNTGVHDCTHKILCYCGYDTQMPLFILRSFFFFTFLKAGALSYFPVFSRLIALQEPKEYLFKKFLRPWGVQTHGLGCAKQTFCTLHSQVSKYLLSKEISAERDAGTALASHDALTS